jgi:V8-like Glu-specific endopeptidase
VTEDGIVDRMTTAAQRFDWSSLSQLAGEYARQLHAATAVSQDDVIEVLDLLRASRQYASLMLAADAALANKPATPAIWRRYAQALIDRDRTAVALRIYTDVVQDQSTSERERDEARGGVGRCYKELFLATTAPKRRAEYLRRSVDAYLGLYGNDPQKGWPGINAAALLARADREKITVPGTSDAGQRASQIAREVLGALPAENEADPWAHATACEAHVALGEVEKAVRRGADFVKDPVTDAFSIASFLRQLLKVWELDTTQMLGNALLPVLRSALLEREGGRVDVEIQDVASRRIKSLESQQLEKVLGFDRYQSLTWYRKGLLRCRAVARIENRNEDGIGTGFLVAGSALHPSLPSTVLVTNGHVIPEGLKPYDAVVVFHGLESDAQSPKQFKVVRQWWHEPSNRPHLDTTVLELDGCPHDVETIPVAGRFPEDITNARAYVIGHPRGLEQPQFSLQDNLMLAKNDTRLHYRSPTEPGSSGSPVFDSQWELIGLHHAGATEMQSLTGEGTYPANEALRIDAIRKAMATVPPEGQDVG